VVAPHGAGITAQGGYMKKTVMLIWKGSSWSTQQIETETGLHDDRPLKLTAMAGDNLKEHGFTLAGICGEMWLYKQD
jgi:hypothetical protein